MKAKGQKITAPQARALKALADKPGCYDGTQSDDRNGQMVQRLMAKGLVTADKHVTPTQHFPRFSAGFVTYFNVTLVD